MNKKDVQEHLKERIDEYLEGKGITTRNNFNCLNPEHDDTNPSMSLDRKRNKAHCFGCNADYDIFDLIGIEYGLTNFNDKYLKACEYFNIDGGASFTQRAAKVIEHEAELIDYSAYILQAHSRIYETDYPSKRGLTDKTLSMFKVGYDPEWQNPESLANGKNPPKQPFLIIPNSINSYFARATTDSTDKSYRKQKAGRSEIFNKQALAPQQNNGHVFIVEGQIDALSFYEIGQVAIGLGGTGHHELLKQIDEAINTFGIDAMPKFYLLLDNDDAGEKSSHKLQGALQGQNLNVISVELPKGYKDANDYLTADKEAFKATTESILIDPLSHERELKQMERIQDDNMQSLLDQGPDVMPVEPVESKDVARAMRAEIEDANLNDYDIIGVPDKWKEYLQADEIEQLYKSTQASHHLTNFFNGIAEQANTPAFSTGFKGLDYQLDGGLYEGLYIMGAISSLGKTTLALQIADQIAQNDQPVFIFSLEMSRNEIIAKTLSRLTYETVIKNNGSDSDAKTTRGITDGRRYKGYTDLYGQKHPPYKQSEKDVITESIKAYETFSDNVYIAEGMGNIGVEHVRDIVEGFTRISDKKPVVIIDYLQILAPYNERANDKQNTDKAVLELKRMSRDLKIPVLAISSFNRENYSSGVSMVSFKESGAIEYSSDVLIGLQFAKQSEIDEKNRTKKSNEPRLTLDHDEEKAKTPREIELKILKNRNGQTGGRVYFNFNPLFNHFEETDGKKFSYESAAKTENKTIIKL